MRLGAAVLALPAALVGASPAHAEPVRLTASDGVSLQATGTIGNRVNGALR